MVFPQIARLELDDLLSQLIDRAQEVLSTQGRLRALLAATGAVSADLSLPLVLRRIVESACQLVGAHYGALGVVGSHGRLTQFVQVGMPPDVAERIGDLPQGRGLLGALITDPQPLRLDDLGDDPRSIGFPDGHPPMRGFLGVPVRVRGQVFGNIYVTEKRDGTPFTAEDEELLTALAGAAAVAIDNAQHYTASQRRQRWLQASADVTTRLLAGADNPLALLAQEARSAADADLCLIWMLSGEEGGKLRVAAADGTSGSVLRGISVVRRDGPVATVLDDARVVAAEEEEASDAALAERGVVVESMVAAPLAGAGPTNGVLALYRLSGSEPFEPDVVEMTTMLAHQAGVALRLAAAQWELRTLEILEERERIGKELHDQVIGRLFAAGLSMQGMAARVGSPEARAQVAAHVEELDDIIATIRRNVFALQRGDG